MKKFKHNKKRNVGLIYELLLRHLSTQIIENDKKGAKITTSILEKHFSKGTELYKEFRLFNALAKSSVSETQIVASILTEAKEAARRTNLNVLEHEKSKLIRDINYKIDNKDFYYQHVENYKDLATIQITLNEWRKDSPDLTTLIEFEKKVGEQLLRSKKEVDIFEEKSRLDASDADKLVLKIMTEKINAKYSNLSPDQREIIKNYVFYSYQDADKLKKYLSERKIAVLTLLENFDKKETNEILLEKVDSVKNAISSISVNNINDSSIVKFLTITKLISELEDKGEHSV